MLERRDILLALALHLGVVGLVMMLGMWQHRHKPEPEHLIQVNMVSLDALQAMMKKTSPASKPVKKNRMLPKLRAKPKPAIQPKLPAKKAVKKQREEPDYDPFAPLEDAQADMLEPEAKSPTLSHMLQGQLSQQELNRYIAAMQRAVERQWRVPLEMMERVQPALVELTLSPAGEVLKVVILESSGSSQLDATLKKAIYAAAPFRLPRQQFELFRVNKIRFYPLQ